MTKRTRRKRPPYKGNDVAPTPETVAKLEGDPLETLIADLIPEAWKIPVERAADEIRAIYSAITIQVTVRGQRLAREARGRYEMPDSLAEAHKERYIPWVEAMGPTVTDWVLLVVMDRDKPIVRWRQPIARALLDYARRL